MHRIIETQIDIDAAPHRVWDVVSDLASWQMWNPFIPSISGKLELGSRLRMTVSPPGLKPMVFKPRVFAVDTGRTVIWGGSFLLFVYRGDHMISLESLPDGRTRLRPRERFMGPLVPFMGKMFGPTEQGYQAMNVALKERVEGSAVEDRQTSSR